MHVRVDAEAERVFKSDKKADDTPLSANDIIDAVNKDVTKHKREHPEQHSDAQTSNTPPATQNSNSGGTQPGGFRVTHVNGQPNASGTVPKF